MRKIKSKENMQVGSDKILLCTGERPTMEEYVKSTDMGKLQYES